MILSRNLIDPINHEINFKLVDSKNTKNIVYIHGFSATWSYYKSFFEQLHKHGYNVYAFDLPNHGANKDVDHQYTFLEYIDYSKKYIKDLNLDSFILMGHSMGGGISTAIVNSFTNIERLILIDAFNYGCSNWAMNAISMISNKVEIPNFEGWFTNNAKTPWFQPAKLALSLFNKDALALLKKEFENIKVPTLAMYGINENIIDPLAAFNFMFPILKNIKGSTFTLIENAKHTPHYENTTKTVEVITNYLK